MAVVDNSIGATLNLSGLDMKTKKVINVGAATASTDAASLANRLDQFTAPTAAVNMNSQELTNLGAPAASTSAMRLSDMNTARDLLTERIRQDDFDDSGSPTTGAAAIVNGAVFGALGWRAGYSGAGGAAVTLVTTNQDANHPGVVRLNRGTTAANISTISRGTATGLGRTVFGSGQTYRQDWIVWIENLSDGINTFAIRFGNINDASTPANGVYFEYVQATSVNWRGCSTASSVVTVASGGSNVAVASGAWVHCYWTWDGTTYSFYVNGTLIGTTTAAQTTAVPEQAGITGSVGTTDRGFLVDLFQDRMQWSTPRGT